MGPQSTAFQWNAGGWFGAQIGGSCWILVAAALVFPRDAPAALAALAAFAATNLIGALVWSQRARLRPLPAMQGLVVLSGIGSALATFILDRAGHFESLGTGATVSARSMYLVLAILIPALLLQFYLIDRRTRGGRR